MTTKKEETKFLTPEQLIRKVFPDNDDPLIWMFYQRSYQFPIAIIEKPCILVATDSKEDEKQQLGARDGQNCNHIVHFYRGNSVDTELHKGHEIAHWLEYHNCAIIDHFK